MTMHFKSQFRFDPSKAFCVGTEREGLILDQKTGRVVSEAERLLRELRRSRLDESFSPELSACQIEAHTPPAIVDGVEALLNERQQVMANAADSIGLSVDYRAVAPSDMPLDHYPKPYYDNIVASLDEDTLRSGCRVLGTHVHVGVSGYEVALRIYNGLVRRFDEIMDFADPSHERLALYQSMAKETWRPRTYDSWADYAAYAQRMGFYSNPRKCWSLLRISVHGTIEFRMLDSIDSVEEIARWARQCHDWCREEM